MDLALFIGWIVGLAVLGVFLLVCLGWISAAVVLAISDARSRARSRAALRRYAPDRRRS